MAEKKITRKVISKVSPKKEEEEKHQPEVGQPLVEKETRTKKVCHFCKSKEKPSYTDTNLLRRFTTDRAKIVPRAKSGLCSKHQRGVTREIKYARHLALLPFTPRV